MPLNAKGEKIEAAMEETYGSEKKAKQVLYASKNKGTITGIDQAMPMPSGVLPETSPSIQPSTGIPTSPPMIPGIDARPPDSAPIGRVNDYARAAGKR